MVTATETPRVGEADADATRPEPLLAVRNLVTEFRTSGGWLRAVNDVSFEVERSEVLAILGESGSGKSALLRTVLGIQPRTARVSGQVLIEGRDVLAMAAAEREVVRGSQVSMIFQDPLTALDPLFTVEQQIVETLRRHTALTKAAARERALELLNLVQIPSPERRLEAYPFELSGGMRQRVVIAIALACNPRLLLADEPTTALDVTVQARVLSLLADLQRRLGMGVVLVTHDLTVAASVADRVAVMYAGRIVERGPIRAIVRRPSHPYTRGLLDANIRPGQRERPEAIAGAPPNLAHLSGGCAFAPRCPVSVDGCFEEQPQFVLVGPDHAARCLIAEADVVGAGGGATAKGLQGG
ncbi:MAG: ABC transporter ATP-binding protein [Dehalococcoidia bacterium]